MRRLIGLGAMTGLASCVAPHAPPPAASSAPRPAPTARAAPQPFRAAPRVEPTYADAPPRLDWRDIPLTPGRWVWQGGAGRESLSHYGEPGQPPSLTLRCDLSRRIVTISRDGRLGGAGGMIVTTSFGAFTLAARDGGSGAPAIVAEVAANDPRLDQIAFSRGRFLVDLPGQAQLVVPAWPEAARVIEDCRG